MIVFNNSSSPGSTPVVSTAVTLDPLKVYGGGTVLILSNLGMKATISSTDDSSASTVGFALGSSNKVYFEARAVADYVNYGGTANNSLSGIQTDAVQSGGIGQTATSLGLDYSNATANINGSNIGSFSSSSVLVGVWIGHAIDFGAKKIWSIPINQPGTTPQWNNDVLANQNPATGTGGYSIAGLSAGTYYAAVNQKDTKLTAAMFINFGTGNSSYRAPLPSGFLNWNGTSTASGSGTVTLDPYSYAYDVTLSNGNLTATSGSGGTVDGAPSFSTTSHTSGKYYFEFVQNSLNGGYASGGVVGGGFFGAQPNYNGGSTTGGFNGAALWTNSGVYYNDVIAISMSFPVGSIGGVAIDLTNKLAWFKNITAAGNWNANVSADPATGVGGLDVSAGLTQSPFFACISVQPGGGGSGINVATVNFGGTAYTGTLPSGFSNW
jgi:hypothetical protein